MANEPESMSEDLRARRKLRLQQISRWLVFAPFLAAPLLFEPRLFPPVIGIGPFSVAVEFRYLRSILLGSSASLLILLPFVLAWSSKPLRWRTIACVSFLVVAGITNVLLALIIYFGVWQFARLPAVELIRELSMPVGFAVITLCGVAVIPTAMRVYSGWQIAEVVEPPNEVSRRERFAEAVLLAMLVGVIFLGGPLIDNQTGISVLPGLFGIAVGGVLTIPVFWLFRDSSPTTFRIVVALNLFLFIAVPGVCFWMTDFARIGLLPAGSGGYFLGAATIASVLLVHVFLFRGMGYRMQRLPFEKARVAPTSKVVVDPLSD